jgi:hypothetical protein
VKREVGKRGGSAILAWGLREHGRKGGSRETDVQSVSWDAGERECFFFASREPGWGTVKCNQTAEAAAGELKPPKTPHIKRPRMPVRCLLSTHEAPEMASSCRASHVLDGCSTPHIKDNEPTPY